MTREEAFRKFQIVRVVEPLLAEQYEREEEEAWRGVAVSGRQADWHQSFHASQFPLHPETACGRKAIYSLLNIPSGGPTSPFLRGVSEAGLDIEDRVLGRFERAGILLTSTDQNRQTNFAVRSHWLTGHTDAIILPRHYQRPHVVEIKTKSEENVNKMKTGQKGPDEKHVAQLMTYIYFTRRGHQALGYDKKGLDLCDDGTVFYISRDNPRNTAEFYFEWNEEMFNKGLELLADWKKKFIDGFIPERPKHFMWGQEPCKWCDVKKVCKADFTEKVTRIRQSNAIAAAQAIVPDYDLERIYNAVIERWKT